MARWVPPIKTVLNNQTMCQTLSHMDFPLRSNDHHKDSSRFISFAFLFCFLFFFNRAWEPRKHFRSLLVIGVFFSLTASLFNRQNTELYHYPHHNELLFSELLNGGDRVAISTSPRRRTLEKKKFLKKDEIQNLYFFI